MKRRGNGLLRASWYLCLAGVFALGLMTIVTCGGGGEGDGNAVEEEPTFLDVYDYTINTDLDGQYLTISFTEGADTFVISVKTLGHFLEGTFNTLTGAYTLDSLSGVSIDSDAGATLLGKFNINVIETVQIPPDSFPTAGTFVVEYGEETVTVTVVSDPSDGVTLSLNGGEATFYDWDTFENLFPSEAPDWQQRATLSFLLLKFMVEQLDFVVDTLAFIGEYEDQLESGSVMEMCDAFPPGAAPDGILQQGSHLLTWQDDSGNGEVSPGDDFTWSFDDCWDDDPNDDLDDLLNGVVNLGSYTEVVDNSNRVTRIGFEAPEGVVFNDFVLSEVDEDPPGTFTVDPNSGIIVNGGFTIVFTE